jgi:hypothetical protein
MIVGFRIFDKRRNEIFCTVSRWPSLITKHLHVRYHYQRDYRVLVLVSSCIHKCNHPETLAFSRHCDMTKMHRKRSLLASLNLRSVWRKTRASLRLKKECTFLGSLAESQEGKKVKNRRRYCSSFGVFCWRRNQYGAGALIPRGTYFRLFSSRFALICMSLFLINT